MMVPSAREQEEDAGACGEDPKDHRGPVSLERLL